MMTVKDLQTRIDHAFHSADYPQDRDEQVPWVIAGALLLIVKELHSINNYLDHIVKGTHD